MKILIPCKMRSIKKCIFLSILILFLCYHLRGITEGGDANTHNQNEGKSGAIGTVSPQAETNDPLYNQAMNSFQARKYSEALEGFKALLQQESSESPKREKILRRTADCRYFLGIEGNKTDLMTATDLYKNIIQRYQDNKDENAIALYRLANGYATLNFFYEAKREFENFASQYPQSPSLPEVQYRISDMLYKTKKFTEAAEKFEEYVRKYPAGEYIKTAYFNLGDCYSQSHQEGKASQWYQDALNKWPDFDKIPEDVLLNVGYHYFKTMKYHDALKIFSFYVNIYSDKDNCKEILFAIARSFMELDQLPLSLKMFSLLIEKFPNSREATEGAIIMANMGIKKPGMKLPFYFHGMQNYRDPLKTYNDILTQFPAGEYVEELLFQKGYALYKKDMFKDCFDTYSRLLSQFPQGRYKTEVVKYFLEVAARLTEEGYAKKDYLSVTDIYFKSREHGLITGDNFNMSYSMGESLKHVGLNDEAMDVFDKLLKTSGCVAERNKILVAMADVENERGNCDNAERTLQQITATSPEHEKKIIPRNRKGKQNKKIIVKQPLQDSHIQKQINRILGNIYLKKGLFDKATQSYAKVLASGDDIDGAAIIYRNYAKSLKALNSLPLAIVNFRKAIEIYNRESQKYSVDVVIDSYRGLGDCLFDTKEYTEAIAMYKQSLTKQKGHNDELWSIYGIGRGYAELNNADMVNKTLSEMKSKGGEGFWSLLADYVVREFSWNDKYSASQN